jgi:hypothetical protein
MRNRWLVYHLNALILIILIQQPEPSVSEAGESRVRNRFREILPLRPANILFHENAFINSGVVPGLIDSHGEGNIYVCATLSLKVPEKVTVVLKKATINSLLSNCMLVYIFK